VVRLRGAGAAVAGVGHVGQSAEDRQLLHAVQWQQAAIVLQQHDALLRCLPGKTPVGVASDHAGRVVPGVPPLGEPHLLADDAQCGVVHHGLRNITVVDQIRQEPVEGVLQRHLHVLPGQCCLFRVAHAEHPVRLDEPLEPPLVAHDAREQVPVLPSPLTVEAVISAHDRHHALVHHAFEVRQVDLVQGPRVSGHVHLEPGVLHRVQREVLDDRHHVSLDPAGQRRPHLAQQIAVLTVGLLRPPPAGMAKQVDARAANHVRALSAGFTPHRIADSFLQVRVPAGTPGAYRSAGGGLVGERDDAVRRWGCAEKLQRERLAVATANCCPAD
jgi:hypothetical protein